MINCHPVFKKAVPAESYRRRLGSLLLYLCDVFRTGANYLPFVLILKRTHTKRTDRGGVRIMLLIEYDCLRSFKDARNFNLIYRHSCSHRFKRPKY